MKDKDLSKSALDFFDAFARSAQNSQGIPTDVSKPFSFSSAGYVEITDDIAEALHALVIRAATLLKSKGAHEKSISDLAMQHAHSFVAENKEQHKAVEALIDQIFDRGGASFQFLTSNFVVRFDKVQEITIGRVKALFSKDFAADYAPRKPESRIQITTGNEFSVQMGETVVITMRPICWLVDVDAVAENVEEESKWLIDIAISFLRLSCLQWGGHFPALGAVEPSPVRISQLQNEGIKFRGPAENFGGSHVPPWYEVDQRIKDISLSEPFIKRANLIFDPPKKSLAERVSQGLGWLTRGRQSADRSERLLFFFTAIEALLSSDDKSAPVVQTIARHAAVILTNDNSERAAQAAVIKKLYGARSALVHAGTRSVLWSGANQAQAIAENLYYEVLNKAALQMLHDTFNNSLAAASYGIVWPQASEAQAPV